MTVLHGDVRFYNNVFVQSEVRQGLKDICEPLRNDEWDDYNLDKIENGEYKVVKDFASYLPEAELIDSDTLGDSRSVCTVKIAKNRHFQHYLNFPEGWDIICHDVWSDTLRGKRWNFIHSVIRTMML